MESNDILSRILYQNSACVVVNKITGEASQRSKSANDGIISLPVLLKEKLNINFAEAAHRLDVPVTGCALFALDREALAYLNSVFALVFSQGDAEESRRRIEKIYWAVIEKPSFSLGGQGELVHWIEENPRVNKSFAHNEEREGRKKAALRYRVTGEGVNYLFLEVNLISGRHHQIRSQLAASGLHIKGDLKYGAKRGEKGGGIRLHARSLSFPNPLNKNEKIRVTADPPRMDNLWEDFISAYETAINL